MEKALLDILSRLKEKTEYGGYLTGNHMIYLNNDANGDFITIYSIKEKRFYRSNENHDYFNQKSTIEFMQNVYHEIEKLLID